ncbi:sialate O-acetylesterase [soil metagenome]
MKKTIFFLLFIVCASEITAQLRLPAVIGDHMVLQQQSDAPLWGWASPSEELTVTGSWGDKIEVKTKATNTGSWKLSLKTPVAGGPYTITIKGKDQFIINDVMIGEVWICSGQSNMEWSVNNGALDAKAEMPNADIPAIRLFNVNKSGANDPQVHGEGEWRLCTPETMKGFSSVGYFFGKKLNADLKAPIGLINVSWGGTPAEVWTPEAKVKNDAALKKSADVLVQKDGWPKDPGVVYNAMIRPLVPYQIAGAIWYQGESNTAAPQTYSQLMKAMIESWRSDFQKEFPFYYVQIAPYTYGLKFQGALIREQQVKTLSVPKTGMIIISDNVPDVKNIHPPNKKPVGDRLANYALGENYKQAIPKSAYQSPVFQSMKIEKNKIRVSFMFGDNGLINRGITNQITIAGDDKKFYPAIAVVDGNTLVVSAKEVKVPVAVRFCFDNASIPNLYNKEGLPVSAFRTDSWEVEMTPENQ